MVILQPKPALPFMSLQDLTLLIQSHHPLIVLETEDESSASELLDSAARNLKLPVFRWSLSGAERASPIEALKMAEHLEVDAIFAFSGINERAVHDPDYSQTVRQLAAKFRFSNSCLALAGQEIALPAEVASDVSRMRVQMPDSDELSTILDEILEDSRLKKPLRNELAERDRKAVISAMQGLTRGQARQSLMRAIFEDGDLGERNSGATVRNDGLIEFYPADAHPVRLPGFENLLDWLEFHNRPEFSRSLLLTGVEGCAESTAVRVIAHHQQLPILRFDASRLHGLSKAEAAAEFEHAVEIAESMDRCVFWIHEIDKAVAKSAEPRILTEILDWVETRREHPGIFFVASANDLGRIPSQLAQAAAFDEVFFIDLPTAAERANIWQIQLRMRGQEPSKLDLGFLIDATDGFSGGEIEQVVVAALCKAAEIGRGVDTQLLTNEIYSTVPLSMSEAHEFSRLRRQAEGRAIPATAPERTISGLAA